MSIESFARKVRQNAMYDLRDNLPAINPPQTERRELVSPNESAELLEQLAPQAEVDRLRALSERLAPGRYRARRAVGSAEKGTRHPHDYLLEKGERETQFLYVDPEHTVGDRTFLRPPVINLVALRLKAGDQPAELAIARVRTPRAVALDKSLVKVEPLYPYARGLIDADGVPAFIKDFPEDVIFRVAIRDGHASVQSRYVSPDDLTCFLDGTCEHSFLRGKAWAQRHVLRQFGEQLERGDFVPYEERIRPARLEA